MTFSPRKYNRDFIAATAVYAGVLLATRLLAKRYDASGLLLVILAGLPIVPAVGATLVYMRHYKTMDELQKRIQVEAFAAGALFVGLATFSLGFVEDVAAPRISLIWVLPAMIASWGFIACLLRYRYAR